MSLVLHYECIRVPVTALASIGGLLVAAEGPYVRFYDNQNFQYLGTRQIFRDQIIHGIAVDSESSHHAILAIWGGPLVRFLATAVEAFVLGNVQVYPTVRAPDWILDLSFGPPSALDSSGHHVAICAAVTAHNALVELKVHYRNAIQDVKQASIGLNPPQLVQLSELTPSSRSILYSAHLLWESESQILVAAGTAFGEIMFWSWKWDNTGSPATQIHRVFLGHEGSIFGVRISEKLKSGSERDGQRFLASCSDDRTIRIWDISGIVDCEPLQLHEASDNQRTRHTGFSNASFDAGCHESTCVAVGWGHLSRVWAVQFLDNRLNDPFPPALLSSGEDASSRLWRFISNSAAMQSVASPTSYHLRQTDTAGFHSGKNIWSTTICTLPSSQLQIISGGADSKITAYTISSPLDALNGSGQENVAEYAMKDLVAIGDPSTYDSSSKMNAPLHKSSKIAEFFRGYTFVDHTSFLLTTNSGKVYLESLTAEPSSRGRIITKSELIERFEDLSGYSICAAESSTGVAFVAGARGSIYMFRRSSSQLLRIHISKGKIGSMFTALLSADEDSRTIVLLVTLMRRKVAQLLYIDASKEGEPAISETIEIPISELLTGLVISSMVYVQTTTQPDYLFLGFRRGSVAVYSLVQGQAFLFRIIERAHAKEAITSMLWVSLPNTSATGHLISTGRDGCCVISYINLSANSVTLVHDLSLPIGPNLEGLYYQNDHLMVYGFSSTKFVVYDTTAEEEIMNVETGGSHRSWAFQPNLSQEEGNILVWTRASSMHICRQDGPNHQVIRSGGHGREIKAVTVSWGARQLIATGAEDTDIKIFEYLDADLICRSTLRKHTTGIQHLQWSDDGEYLFSSGGCEEFYIWRVRNLPPPLGIGVVCESFCVPESEHSDLRITSFDIRKSEGPESRFLIAMVYSDSHIRVYSYDSNAATKWHTLANGIYFTSCLTQSIFLSTTTILTAGTDGHTVLWSLPTSVHRLHNSTPYSPAKLTWKHPARIHQNTSKTLDSHALDSGCRLVVSGGDDGSLAFLLVSTESVFTHPPVVAVRAHASAITACSIVSRLGRIFVLTSGNDQWLRLWEVFIHPSTSPDKANSKDPLEVTRIAKTRTNIADVSSMAVVSQTSTATKIIVCGVGMEVLRLDWDTQSQLEPWN